MLETKAPRNHRSQMISSGITLALIVMLNPALATADKSTVNEAVPATKRTDLGIFAGAGYLGSPGGNGSTFTTGLRLGIGRHFAVSFDLGYGLLGTHPAVQDRWWLIPSAALVIPAGRVRFDLGAGLGLGASSGYVSWSGYLAKPFTPTWAFQLVPTVRAHAIAAVDITRDFDMFIRLDAATLLLLPGSHARISDTTWATLSLGVQFRLL